MSSGTAAAAIPTGIRRGLIEFRNSLRSPADVGYYLVGTVVFVVVLYFNRNSTIEGFEVEVSAALFIFPGVLAMVATFAALMGLATVVATEREDGTLLRCKALPNGLTGYVVGQVTRTASEALFSILLLVIPATLIISGLWSIGPTSMLVLLAVLSLGLLGCVAIGLCIGSLFKNPRAVGGWGFLLLGGLIFISGIFVPLAGLPDWAQIVGQIFPLYWIGLGLRSALLPDGAEAIEIGESWRLLETFGVLGAWAIVGLVLAPILLRRMARRESGSSVQERRDAAMQRV